MRSILFTFFDDIANFGGRCKKTLTNFKINVVIIFFDDISTINPGSTSEFTTKILSIFLITHQITSSKVQFSSISKRKQNCFLFWNGYVSEKWAFMLWNFSSLKNFWSGKWRSQQNAYMYNIILLIYMYVIFVFFHKLYRFLLWLWKDSLFFN